MPTNICLTERQRPREQTPLNSGTDIDEATFYSPFLKKGKCLSDNEIKRANFNPKISDFVKTKDSSIIGKGAFGEVWKLTHRQLHQDYAIKIINKQHLIGTPAFTNIKEEANIHKQFMHDNIIRLYSSLEDERKIYLVLEYAAKGNLFFHIKKHKTLCEEDAFYFFIQACSGLYFLHTNGYIHKDIKPENLLICENGTLKICDFGWCTRQSTKQ